MVSVRSQAQQSEWRLRSVVGVHSGLFGRSILMLNTQIKARTVVEPMKMRRAMKFFRNYLGNSSVKSDVRTLV